MSKNRRIRYSLNTARRVEEAFWSLARECDLDGRVVMPYMIADQIGLSRNTTSEVLSDAIYWSDTRKKACRTECAARSNEIQSANGYPKFAIRRSTQAMIGFPDLRKAILVRATIKKGYKYHPMAIQGMVTRKCILNYLSNGYPSEYKSNRQVSICVANALGFSESRISFQLRRLRAEGLIDEHNRPIPPQEATA